MARLNHSKPESTDKAHEDIFHTQPLSNSQVSLKDWKTLQALVNCGSYANAAEFLHISQPAVSYCIAKIEEQLGLPLLKLEGRKAKITEPGSALLKRAQSLLRVAAELEEFAEELRQTWRPEIRLAIDQNFPTHIIMPSIRAFSSHNQNAKVRLTESSPQKIEKALHECAADLAINSQVPAGFQGDLLVETELLPVAHPEHRLFNLQRNIKQADLDDEVEIVFNPESPACAQQNKQQLPSLKSMKLWEVSNFDTVESALIEGLGYAWLPKHRVQKMVDFGKLMVLPLGEITKHKLSFYMIHGRSSIPTCEVSRLTKTLRNAVF